MRTTMVHRVGDAPGTWDVFHIRTASSEYDLAVKKGGERRVAVLRGVSASAGAVDAQDSAPRVGGRSLFDVPPDEWVGHPLEIGTICTSPVVAVVKEYDFKKVVALTSSLGAARAVAPPPAPEPPPERRLPYPESMVDLAESCAGALQRLHRGREALVNDVSGDPELHARLQVAITQCAIFAQGLGRKLNDE